MRFPNASDIASTSVVCIDIENTISDAIEKMILNEHRDIIVQNQAEFYVLRALEIIEIYRKDIDLNASLKNLNLIKLPVVSKDDNILSMLKYLEEKTEYICVRNSDFGLYGLITHTDITSNIDPEILMENYKVDDFLKLIRRVRWIDKSMITEKVLSDMLENSYDSVIVVENLKPIGILTTKDIVRLIKERSNLTYPIENYMVSPVDSVNKDISIADALNFIKRKHYKRVIVVDDNGVLVGVVTQKELISLTYTNWSLMMREHQEELREINTMLKTRNKEYELLASTDHLTGLYNRYKFKELYDSSFRLMVQRKSHMSIIMLDIDYFKRVNDTYGHNIGDKVLILIAKILLESIRDIDMVCRWGGEEFLVLLPAVELEKAKGIAQKIRQKIEQTPIDVVGRITASLGVAQVDYSLSMEEVIGKADEALYLAKNSGRNNVKP